MGCGSPLAARQSGKAGELSQRHPAPALVARLMAFQSTGYRLRFSGLIGIVLVYLVSP